MCKSPSWRFEPALLPPTTYNHLYLWNDHRVKGMRWFAFLVDVSTAWRPSSSQFMRGSYIAKEGGWMMT